MKSISELEYYLVTGEGTTEKLSSFEKKSDSVYVVVDHKERVIALWKGINAPIRLKFIGSRALGDTRKDVGYHYKTDVVDEGDESRSFKERVLGVSGDTDTKPVGVVSDGSPEFTSYAEAAEQQGVEIDDAEIDKIRTGGVSGKFAKMGGLGSRPQQSFLASPQFFEENKESKKQVRSALQAVDLKEVKSILNELGPAMGYSREMIVIGAKVYRIAGTDNDVEFEDLDNPLDGIIMIKDYIPRLICDGGTVQAIELLKRTSEDVIEEEFTQDLADLTAMFQIEIE